MKEIHFVFKKSDGGVVINSPHPLKFGPEEKIVYKEEEYWEYEVEEKEVVVEKQLSDIVNIVSKDNDGKEISTPTLVKKTIKLSKTVKDTPRKVKKTRTVVDYIIRPYEKDPGYLRQTDPTHPKFVGEVRDFVILDSKISKHDLESRKQLYWENDDNGNTVIKKDLAWEKRLMPDHIIKKKHLARCRENMTALLSVELSDQLEILRLRHHIDKCIEEKAGVHNENVFWTEVALENLDKKVAKGESDKPSIREKLLKNKLELSK